MKFMIFSASFLLSTTLYSAASFADSGVVPTITDAWSTCSKAWVECAYEMAVKEQAEVKTAIERYANSSGADVSQFCDNNLNNVKYAYNGTALRRKRGFALQIA